MSRFSPSYVRCVYLPARDDYDRNEAETLHCRHVATYLSSASGQLFYNYKLHMTELGLVVVIWRRFV